MFSYGPCVVMQHNHATTKKLANPKSGLPGVDLGVAGHTDHTRKASQRAKVPDSLRIDNHMRIEGNLTWKAKYKSSPHGAACTEIWASHDNTREVNSGIVDCSLIHVTWEARQHTHVITKDLGNPKSGLPGVDIGGAGHTDHTRKACHARNPGPLRMVKHMKVKGTCSHSGLKQTLGSLFFPPCFVLPDRLPGIQKDGRRSHHMAVPDRLPLPGAYMGRLLPGHLGGPRDHVGEPRSPRSSDHGMAVPHLPVQQRTKNHEPEKQCDSSIESASQGHHCANSNSRELPSCIVRGRHHKNGRQAERQCSQGPQCCQHRVIDHRLTGQGKTVASAKNHPLQHESYPWQAMGRAKKGKTTQGRRHRANAQAQFTRRPPRRGSRCCGQHRPHLESQPMGTCTCLCLPCLPSRARDSVRNISCAVCHPNPPEHGNMEVSWSMEFPACSNKGICQHDQHAASSASSKPHPQRSHHIVPLSA